MPSKIEYADIDCNPHIARDKELRDRDERRGVRYSEYLQGKYSSVTVTEMLMAYRPPVGMPGAGVGIPGYMHGEQYSWQKGGKIVNIEYSGHSTS